MIRLLTVFYLSGVAALIYQTIWIKQLTLVVGVDVYAITTGVSGFFAGLALGSTTLRATLARQRSARNEVPNAQLLSLHGVRASPLGRRVVPHYAACPRLR